MAHYGRVAYTNLRFSEPSRDVEGWRTDAGRAHIKFGRPVRRVAIYQSLAESWYYEGFGLSFRNTGMGPKGFGRSLVRDTPGGMGVAPPRPSASLMPDVSAVSV